MTKEAIKKLLDDNILKNELSIEELEEYKNLFNTASEVINEKVINKQKENFVKETWFFIEEVNNDLKNYSEKIEYIFNTKENTINELIINNSSDAIKFIVLDIKIILQFYGVNLFYITIYTENNNYITKLENIDNKIRNIFPKFYPDSTGGWIYNYYFKKLDEENPKEIASIMIKLYTLLKENIK